MSAGFLLLIEWSNYRPSGATILAILAALISTLITLTSSSTWRKRLFKRRYSVIKELPSFLETLAAKQLSEKEQRERESRDKQDTINQTIDWVNNVSLVDYVENAPIRKNLDEC